MSRWWIALAAVGALGIGGAVLVTRGKSAPTVKGSKKAKAPPPVATASIPKKKKAGIAKSLHEGAGRVLDKIPITAPFAKLARVSGIHGALGKGWSKLDSKIGIKGLGKLGGKLGKVGGALKAVKKFKLW